MENLTELTRKYLLDSAELIKRIADSMLCVIHRTRTVADLDIYVKQALSIYVMAIGHTPFYNTDLIPDFDDYTTSFNSIVFGISNSDLGEHTSYIFALVDSLYRVLSKVCNSNYFKYVKTNVPIVLDDDLDIDPFYDELIPLPLEWIEMNPEERVLTFIYRGKEFSIKNVHEFDLAYDMILFEDSKILLQEVYRSNYFDFVIGNECTFNSVLPPFSEKSYEYYLKKYQGLKSFAANYEMNLYRRLIHSFKNTFPFEVLKIKKRALNSEYGLIL